MERVATTVTYSASGATVIAGLALNEWIALAGLIVAIATFGITWLYKHRHYKLAERQVEQGQVDDS